MTLTRGALAACACAAVLTLSACSGGQAEERAPQDVLAAAKSEFDQTTGVRLSLSTEKLPPRVDGILSAIGVGTHDPAFEGDLKVSTGGFTADVPVVAARGKVFAQLPFTTEFVEVDPAAYAAPDPAGLMEAEGGLSSLLTAAEGLEAGEEVRSGKDVLTSYTGTVPGEVVAGIIPSASAGADFDAAFTVDDDDRLREAVLTGPFYPDVDAVTYTITVEDYDITADVALP